MLAALSMGIALPDLDSITIGMVIDLCLEKTGEGYTEIEGNAVDDFFLGR
jgi:hypothetical protein